MVRWTKLFAEQYLGCWILGVALFALQEVPYMLMPLLKLTQNPLMNMRETSVVLDICEKILGTLCVVSMVFVVRKDVPFFQVGEGWQKAGFLLAIAVLLLNFAGWGLYFRGHQSVGVMLFFLVLLPPLYYACIGLWRKNWLLLAGGIGFALVHVVHVYGNLRQ